VCFLIPARSVSARSVTVLTGLVSVPLRSVLTATKLVVDLGDPFRSGDFPLVMGNNFHLPVRRHGGGSCGG